MRAAPSRRGAARVGRLRTGPGESRPRWSYELVAQALDRLPERGEGLLLFTVPRYHDLDYVFVDAEADVLRPVLVEGFVVALPRASVSSSGSSSCLRLLDLLSAIGNSSGSGNREGPCFQATADNPARNVAGPIRLKAMFPARHAPPAAFADRPSSVLP